MRFGRYYEEFEIGAVYQHWPARTIAEYDNQRFPVERWLCCGTPHIDSAVGQGST
jgi:hypothetical protein